MQAPATSLSVRHGPFGQNQRYGRPGRSGYGLIHELRGWDGHSERVVHGPSTDPATTCPGDGLGSALERPADLAGQDEDPGPVELEDPLEAILRIDEPPAIRSRPGDDDVAGQEVEGHRIDVQDRDAALGAGRHFTAQSSQAGGDEDRFIEREERVVVAPFERQVVDPGHAPRSPAAGESGRPAPSSS